MLDWKPCYQHSRTKPPPKTNLTMETAADVYQKLKKFLGVKEKSLCPAAGWPETRNKDFHRHLFQKNGFHHAVRWMPNLKEGWRRMLYIEFCCWYGIYQ